MAFYVKPQKEFLVRPALPASLSRMSELAYNLLWSWDHNLRALFGGWIRPFGKHAETIQC